MRPSSCPYCHMSQPCTCMYIKLISFVQPNERNIPNKNFQLEITLVTEQIGIKDYNENNYKYCKGKEGN